MSAARDSSPEEPGRLAGRLKAWALEEGFDRAGVATLEPSQHGDIFLRWLERGDHAGMRWLERRVEARLDPSRVLEGSLSALCVALHYHPLYRQGEEGGGEAIPEPSGDLWPRVARYARGEDYHDVMGDRLRRLAARIEAALPDCRTRRYVDTGPVLERELASRAGLGRIGKHTNLLHPEAGSWFLVGELFLTLDLEPDRPLADMCGSCRRCLDACPTGALPEPYRLDSNRCISYWTIEHRGVLPPAARELMGDWVFGCDVCQEVCPWNGGAGNRRPRGGFHPELELPLQRADLDLVGLLVLDREQYVERFRGSPMKRAKLSGLRRNAAIAMGNRRDRRYVAALVRSLVKADAELRRALVWALGRIGGAEAETALRRRLTEEENTGVRDEIEAALRGLSAPGGRAPAAARPVGG